MVLGICINGIGVCWFTNFFSQKQGLREILIASVALEQLTVAPRAIYTRGNDAKKNPVNGLATERSTLLGNEQTIYSNGRRDSVTEMSDNDFADAAPASLIFYGESSDDGGSLHERLTGDPLTGKLFGQRPKLQIMSSWFW